METYSPVRSSARNFYEKILFLYPAVFRMRHRDELLQNFDDLERDVRSGRLLWAFIISDLCISLGREYMEYIRTHRWMQLALTVLVALLALFAWQVNYLHWAHSSFATYAQFRGCETITSKTATDGTCTTASGQTVKIVEFDGKWYLDGDLPWACVPGTNFCVGF